MSDLLPYARKTVGLGMGSISQGRRIGWTPNERKAQLMREAGAHVTTVRPQSDSGEIGWEVSFLLDAQRLQREDAPNGHMGQ